MILLTALRPPAHTVNAAPNYRARKLSAHAHMLIPTPVFLRSSMRLFVTCYFQAKLCLPVCSCLYLLRIGPQPNRGILNALIEFIMSWILIRSSIREAEASPLDAEAPAWCCRRCRRARGVNSILWHELTLQRIQTNKLITHVMLGNYLFLRFMCHLRQLRTLDTIVKGSNSLQTNRRSWKLVIKCIRPLNLQKNTLGINFIENFSITEINLCKKVQLTVFFFLWLVMISWSLFFAGMYICRPDNSIASPLEK